MASAIKKFRFNAEKIDPITFNFDDAEKKALEQFDMWRKTEKPTILAINFGTVFTGPYSGDSQCYYIHVLYDV